MPRPQPHGPIGFYIPDSRTPEQLVDLALADGRRQYHKISPERAVVNCLRHEFTTYDEFPSQSNHFKVCRRIARMYPHLTEECARQVRARARKEGTGKATDPALTFWFDNGTTLTIRTTDPIPPLDAEQIVDTTYGIFPEED